MHSFTVSLLSEVIARTGQTDRQTQTVVTGHITTPHSHNWNHHAVMFTVHGVAHDVSQFCKAPGSQTNNQSTMMLCCESHSCLVLVVGGL